MDTLILDYDDLDTHGCAHLEALLDAMRTEGLEPEWTEFRQAGAPHHGSDHYGSVHMLGKAGAVIEDHDLGPVVFLFHIDFDKKERVGELGFGPLSLVCIGGEEKLNQGWRPIFNRVNARWEQATYKPARPRRRR